MNVKFHPETEAEFFNAINYYEECEIGLGYDFSIEVYTTIRNILNYPKAWPILEGEIRRCQTRRFPFGLIYNEEENKEILILAVMHLHRKPHYWKERLR